jgi:serine/threonine protein kinase
MEYINGGNLFSFLKKRRKVSEKTAKFLFKQIILGIQYIHDHNIVHRDIKLENILIDLNNNIKICDFGIGRVLSDPEQLLYDQCGTPMYIAPEILLSTKEKGYKGFPVDIWSSGIALYILLSGTLPFSFKDGKSMSIEESEKNNDNSEELQYSIVNNEPKYIENISIEARDLLRGLLDKNPEKRLTIEQILAHPWLKGVNENLDNNKYHLFTKAEMKMLSKTYVDYRKDKTDNLKENFTLSNLFIDDKNKNNKNEKNEETKSSILAPFNSVYENHNNVDDDFYEDEIIMDDFNNKKIRLENEIISVGNKVKEYNMLYEMNNNCEVDNGIIINSKTNTLTTVSNKSLISLADSFTDMLLKKENKKDKEKENKKNKNIYDNNFSSYGILQEITDESHNNDKYNENNDNINQINNILNQIELLGYNKQYVQECIKNNVLCHASTAYFLMLNYDKI